MEIKDNTKYEVSFRADGVVEKLIFQYKTPNSHAPLEYFMEAFVNYCAEMHYENIWISSIVEV